MKYNKKIIAVGLISFTLLFFTNFHNKTFAIDTSDTIGVINSFGVPSETGRSFSWHLPNDGSTSSILYCEKIDYSRFCLTQCQKVDAIQYTTTTDKGNRQICKASITGLMPNTEYAYCVESSTGKKSRPGFFKTAPEIPEAFSFINITDTQGYATAHYDVWANTLRQALTQFPNTRFLIHCGDIVDNGDDIKSWDDFSNAPKTELMGLPITPTVGNHDSINSNKTNPNKKNFKERFNLPEIQEFGVYTGTIYSYNYGNAHFVVLNTETSYEGYQQQKEWLRKDVASANKQWNIVAMHQSMYGSYRNLAALRAEFGPVFDELGIDLVLQGHDHNYVRTYPMYDQKIQTNGKGTIYMIANTGGIKYYNYKSRPWIQVGFQPRVPMYICVGINGNKMWLGAYDHTNTLLDSTLIYK